MRRARRWTVRRTILRQLARKAGSAASELGHDVEVVGNQIACERRRRDELEIADPRPAEQVPHEKAISTEAAMPRLPAPLLFRIEDEAARRGASLRRYFEEIVRAGFAAFAAEASREEEARRRAEVEALIGEGRS